MVMAAWLAAAIDDPETPPYATGGDVEGATHPNRRSAGGYTAELLDHPKRPSP
jgi:hypothetical protein